MRKSTDYFIPKIADGQEYYDVTAKGTMVIVFQMMKDGSEPKAAAKAEKFTRSIAKMLKISGHIKSISGFVLEARLAGQDELYDLVDSIAEHLDANEVIRLIETN